MFKNHALTLSVVKKNKTNTTNSPVAVDALDPEKINTLVKDQVRHTAIVTVAAAASIFALRTLSEIAINNTNPKYK